MITNFRSEFDDYEAYVPYLDPPRSCPVCGEDESEIWAMVGSYRAVRCILCTHVYMEQVPSEEGLDKYYNDYIAFRLQNTEKLVQRAKMYEIDRDYLFRHISSGHLLDIGCSSGELLLVLGQDFDSYGIDRDVAAVEIAIRRGDWLSDRIRVGTLDGPLDWTGGQVDVAIMRGVIEHLVNPKSVVEQVSNILKPGGVFFVTATPNIDCLCAEVFREKWNQFDPIQHISYFDAKTLSLLGREFGLILEAQYYPYLRTPYANPPEDIRVIREAIVMVASGRRSEIPRSPAFWGNMMTLVFRKENVQADDLTDFYEGMSPNELDKAWAQRICLVIRHSLPAGHRLTQEDLGSAPALGGLSVDLLGKVVGKRLLYPTEAKTPLTFGILE